MLKFTHNPRPGEQIEFEQLQAGEQAVFLVKANIQGERYEGKLSIRDWRTDEYGWNWEVLAGQDLAWSPDLETVLDCLDGMEEDIWP